MNIATTQEFLADGRECVRETNPPPHLNVTVPVLITASATLTGILLTVCIVMAL